MAAISRQKIHRTRAGGVWNVAEYSPEFHKSVLSPRPSITTQREQNHKHDEMDQMGGRWAASSPRLCVAG